jgi:hypothetical protein
MKGRRSTVLQKFAATRILDARIAEGRTPRLMTTAHRVAFNYEPRPGYLYVRSRMISSRCNDNYDEFPADEIAKGYHTFIGKPVFVNHHNEDHTRARGVIIDAALHKDANPDGSPDIWVEGLMEVDALTFPKLAKAIVAGHIDRTSMGVDVAFSVCAVCNNKATTPLEYCRHIPAMKGAKVMRRTADGSSRSELVRERCHGLSFFENSLLVEEPADPTAYFLGSVERGPGLEHLGSIARTASRSTPGQARFYVSHGLANKEIHVSASRSSFTYAGQEIAGTPAGPLSAVGLRFVHAGRCPGCAGLNTIASLDGQADCFDCEHVFTARLDVDDPVTPMAPLVPHRPPDEMDDQEKTAWNQHVKAHAQEWHARNPPSVENIVDHWHAASSEEKENGKNWYADAHFGTKAIADATKTPMHVAAGLVSTYSPQTHWATNIVTAASAMRQQRGVGGKGNKDAPPGVDKKGNPVPKGFKTTDGQRAIADELISNHTHYNDLLKGHKTRAFAHLIEHGGDHPDDVASGNHRVCVDRHAMSVACGGRMSDAAYGHSGLSTKGKYNQLQDMYRTAAKHISAHEGEDIHPHQVQAATWLVRQRLNEHHDRAVGIDGSRSAANARHAVNVMNQYMGEHHPELSIHMPGTGYSKDPSAASKGPTELEKVHHEDRVDPKFHAPGQTTARRRRGR